MKEGQLSLERLLYFLRSVHAVRRDTATDGSRETRRSRALLWTEGARRKTRSTVTKEVKILQPSLTESESSVCATSCGLTIVV